MPSPSRTLRPLPDKLKVPSPPLGLTDIGFGPQSQCVLKLYEQGGTAETSIPTQAEHRHKTLTNVQKLLQSVDISSTRIKRKMTYIQVNKRGEEGSQA